MVNCPAVARFTRDQLRSYVGATVDDLLGPDVRLLFVGINPGLWTAAANAHFAKPGNRFWPALYRGGLTDWLVDASGGLRPDDLAMVQRRGIGISNLAPMATARADELSLDQLRAGATRLVQLVCEVRPAVVAVLGLTAYRSAFGRPKAVAGRQSEPIGDAELWVLANPSGLNAHDTVDTLAAAYRSAAVAAGVVPDR